MKQLSGLRQLIINADDFGLSEGANRAIISAFQEGILTSASLMAGGAAFDQAVVLAKENPGLQVGLHLTLVHGRAALPPDEIPGLVDRDGRFTDNPVEAGMRYFFDKNLHRQLFREIERQIQKIRSAGIPLSHVDGHLNIHMHPVVFDILVELMPKYGIFSFRLTCESLPPNLAVDRHRVFGKMLDAFIFSSLARRCRPKLAKLGIAHAGEVKGLLNSGRMTEGYLLRALDSITEGVTEIYFHPGCYPCSALQGLMPDYLHEQELAALTSPRVKQKLALLGVKLRNYRGEEKNYV
jgi:chitin disaccharide deacetylase